MDRNLYAADGEYFLYELAEEDKECYMELLRQVNTLEGFYDDPIKSELMWRASFIPNEKSYSIYDSKGLYSGNIILKDINSTTPEIGIDIVESERNKGIAPKCIKLLARSKYNEKDDIEYFLIRVRNTNMHSRHMVEKLGAARIENEEPLEKKLLQIFGTLDETEKQEIKFFKYENQLKEEAEGYICRYKFTPDLF